jgi:hypothetical protein
MLGLVIKLQIINSLITHIIITRGPSQSLILILVSMYEDHRFMIIVINYYIGLLANILEYSLTRFTQFLPKIFLLLQVTSFVILTWINSMKNVAQH